MFESLLIIVSILVALALDEWRDDQNNEQNIDQALSNFISEIQQNKARVDDAAPFNRGLRDVLTRRQALGEIDSVRTFIGNIESYEPVVLQSTAWETAIATGALAKMDYDLVSALSLTYSLQNRYQQVSRNGANELTSPQNLSEENLDLAVYNAIRYLNDVTSMETELGAVYLEAEMVIQAARGEPVPVRPDESASDSRDIAHP